MAAYKVTYFDARGNGEIIRLTLKAAGQTFEDERIQRENWAELKPKTPMKAMPLLTITQDGKSTVYCQSGSCAKYLAKKYGFFGSTPEEEMLIDEVFEGVMDTIRELYKPVFEQDEAKKKELQKKFVEEAVPKLADYFNKRKEAYGKNGYIIGGKLTLADLQMFGWVDQMTSIGQGDIFDKYPDLKTHWNLVKSNKNIAEWLDARPKTQF